MGGERGGGGAWENFNGHTLQMRFTLCLCTPGNSFGFDCVGKVKLRGNRHVIETTIAIVLSAGLMLRLLLLIAMMMPPCS